MRRTVTRDDLVSEDQIQETIIGGLRAFGYTVLVTSNRGIRSTCPRCAASFTAFGGYGATPGVPDLIVTRNNWAIGQAMLVEVKGPKTKLSPEQEQLRKSGRIVIVRSWEDMQRELFEFLKRMKGAA